MKTNPEPEASGVQGEGWVLIIMFLISISVLFGIWFWGYRSACKDLEKRIEISNEQPTTA